MNTTPENTTAFVFTDNWFKSDDVRHDDTHSLRIDSRLTPGERVARNWRCICGKNFGLLYDNAAKSAYRLHRKETK